MVKLGILVIILSVVFMLVFMFVPDALKLVSPLICKENEHLTSTSRTFNTSTSTRTNFYYNCVDSEGNERSVTGEVILADVIGFLVLLFAGIGLTAVGASRATARAKQAAFGANVFGQPQMVDRGDGVTVITSQARMTDINNPLVTELMQGLKDGVIRMNGMEVNLHDLKPGMMHVEMANGGKLDLTHALQQLEDAHKNGLLTDDEYQKTRQKILDRLT